VERSVPREGRIVGRPPGAPVDIFPRQGTERCPLQKLRRAASLTAARHRPEVPLPGEELAEGIADVDDTDLRAGEAGCDEGALDDLTDQPVDADALSGQVAREVALVTAENPHPDSFVSAAFVRRPTP
jgi:hypothetical protein